MQTDYGGVKLLIMPDRLGRATMVNTFHSGTLRLLALTALAYHQDGGLTLIEEPENGEQHEYVPDFLIRLVGGQDRFLILEPKGYDPLKDVKRAAAERWCAAVNAHGGFGHWQYRMIKRPEETIAVLNSITA